MAKISSKTKQLTHQEISDEAHKLEKKIIELCLVPRTPKLEFNHLLAIIVHALSRSLGNVIASAEASMNSELYTDKLVEQCKKYIEEMIKEHREDKAK